MRIREVYFLNKENELASAVNADIVCGTIYDDQGEVCLEKSRNYILSIYSGNIFFTYKDSYKFNEKDLAPDYEDFMMAKKTKTRIISYWKILTDSRGLYLYEKDQCIGRILKQQGNYCFIEGNGIVFVNWLSPLEKDIQSNDWKMEKFLSEDCRPVLLPC